MGKRELDSRLQELYNAGKKVYSISKINTINECLYEAYNSYILHNRGLNGVYGILGTKIHDKLEAIINGTASCSELPNTLKEELDELEMLGIEFPKDFKGNDTIRNNWVADMEHFCKNFIKPEGKFKTEELFIYKLNDDRYVQGYIDLICENDDDTISIIDWKTSSEFSKDDLLHHGRQLVLYALAKEEQGIKVKSVAWYMLKYCQVSFMGRKRSNSKTLSPITKIINRGKLVSELKSHIEFDLINAGYDEVDIECMLNTALQENSLDSLPADIRKKYTIKPYIRQYELTDALKQECIDYINKTADLFESLDASKDINFPPRKFTRINGAGNEVEDTFFCHTLCNYRNSCKHIKTFDELQKIAKETTENEEDNLF